MHRKCVMPQARTGKQIRAGEDWNQRGLNSAILAELDVIGRIRLIFPVVLTLSEIL